jgi:transketolase
MEENDLKTKSNAIKRNIVSMIANAGGGHLGCSLSEADILTVLFFHVMNFSPENLQNQNRDRFVLSKGHASEGLYAVLAEKGFFPKSILESYLKPDCPLTIHPNNHVPGIEICTGALGHGFSIAVGLALAAQKHAVLEKHEIPPFRVFTLVGDGELEEGSNWEAAMAASHFKLGNLTLIVDNNGLQLADSVANTMNIEPLGEKFGAFGFDVHKVDGHDVKALSATFDSLDYASGKPHLVIAKTIKGKGVSFAENKVAWHHTIPTNQEAEIALKELAEHE